jgi:hypothetical protein
MAYVLNSAHFAELNSQVLHIDSGILAVRPIAVFVLGAGPSKLPACGVDSLVRVWNSGPDKEHASMLRGKVRFRLVFPTLFV